MPPAASAPPFLTLERIRMAYGPSVAVDDVSLDVAAGELLCLLGPSGCGKTTLLRIIAGLELQHDGRVLLRGRDITATGPAGRGCGIVFQSYALFPNLTVGQNVAYGLHGRGQSRNARRERAREMLAMVGLDHYEGKYPAQLSGGEQQRVALARALAPNPSILLLDEPLSALDARVRLRLRDEIRGLQQRLGITTILVTHDQEEALTMADRVAVLNRGRIVQTAEPAVLYDRPAEPFVAAFLGSMNFLSGWTADGAGVLTHGGLRLAGDGAACTPGARYTVAVRPEQVRVLDGGHGANDGANVFTARVEHLAFRGSTSRLRVALEAHADQRVEVEMHPSALERHALHEGAPVTLHLPPSSLLFYPESREH